MATQDTLRRLRDTANRLRSDISKASDTAATQRTRAANATTAADKTKNASMAKSKRSEAERATKAANDAEKKRAAAEKKLSDVERDIVKNQNKYEKEREAAQVKALADLSRKADQASAQFRPQWRAVRSVGHPLSISVEPAHDVFLSHASEDKDAIARPLRDALEDRDISVWFDEIKIKVGQSIRQRIEEGIARCRFGVVVLSSNFFAKQWARAELDGLFSGKMDSGENMVLPVWHHISKDEVVQHSPLLVGIAALNTATMTLDEIAESLAEAVRT